MLEALEKVQLAAINYYCREKVQAEGSMEHVLMSTSFLAKFVDAEMRHVSLSPHGLADSLSRIFVECLCAIRGKNIDGIDMPRGLEDLCSTLRNQVFLPRNEKYGNTFGDFGAVGVVIRLMDHAQALKYTSQMMSVAHIANFAAMAMVLLVDSDPDFLS